MLSKILEIISRGHEMISTLKDPELYSVYFDYVVA